MPKRKSAGILLYRVADQLLQVFLVHPGGPFWRNKDDGSWTIPKGEIEEDEHPLNAAKREFQEETGKLLQGSFVELSPIVQKAGKIVYAWAVEGELDPQSITCNNFKLEWPPRSGKWVEYPEVDAADWFNIDMARRKINPAQVAFLEELVARGGQNQGDTPA
ncbi:MAG TPA: NUDIX domain-containing protein [Chitinophagaceae bacterium]|nr:NUDIX domain-containing protein [Chitinophagaceae bacterium]